MDPKGRTRASKKLLEPVQEARRVADVDEGVPEARTVKSNPTRKSIVRFDRAESSDISLISEVTPDMAEPSESLSLYPAVRETR